MKNNNRLFWGILLSSTCLVTGESKPYAGIHSGPYGIGYGYDQELPITKKINAYEKLAEQQAKLEIKLKSASSKEQEDLNIQLNELIKARKQLITEEKFDQKLGRAMVQGFAGPEAGLLYRDVEVANFWDGMWLGLGISSAQATSKVVGKHVGNTADLLIGGIWDTLITKLIDATQLVRDGLFHGGHAPFKTVEITGLATMVNTTFVNLNTMLRDGLKDMLRGQDMTLRLAEDQQETNHRTLGWRMLVGAYTRQIDYIIQLIQQRLPYYDKNSQIVFFAEEIVRCLEDVKRILTEAKNVRELDERLDSNKNLINAMKANIANLFAGLKELVEPAAQKNSNYGATTKNSRAGGYGHEEDDGHFPHSPSGRYN